MKIGPVLLTLLVLSSIDVSVRAQDEKPAKPARAKKVSAPEPKNPENLKAVPPKEVDDAIRRGRELLLAQQESLDDAKNTKSEWPYEGVYRVGPDIPIGYRIGGTSICALAVIDSSSEKPDTTAKNAVLCATDFVLENLDDPLMSIEFEKGYDVRGWGHAYALSFLLKLRQLGLEPAEKKELIEARIKALVEILKATQIGSRGGWNYSRPSGDGSSPSTFMTAPTLQILFEARNQGFAVDDEMVERGLKVLEDARLETGAFQYSSDPARQTGKGFEDIAGATGRSPICETTLYLAGRGSVDRIRTSIDRFFENWRWLEQRRRQNGTHVAPYYIAPYYFFYAHRYAAQAIEFLPADERPEYRQRLYQLLWHVRETDGGWNDRVFPRSENFGTAMTLFALDEPSRARPAGWSTMKPETGTK